MSGLGDGTVTLTAYLTDTVSNQGSNTTSSKTKDTSIPVQSAWSPAYGSTITTATPTITLTLNENGDCKSSLTNQGYADMTTDCTGDGTTSISCTTSDLGSNGIKFVYIACEDNVGNKDTILTNTVLQYTLSTGGGGVGGGIYVPPIQTPTDAKTQPTTPETGNKTVWCQNFDAYLASWSTDATSDGQVSYLQTALTKEGFDISEDPEGVFGQATIKSLKSFQTKYGITPTGTTGPVTRARLNSLYACKDTTPAATDNTSEDQSAIERIKQMIQQLRNRISDILSGKAPASTPATNLPSNTQPSSTPPSSNTGAQYTAPDNQPTITPPASTNSQPKVSDIMQIYQKSIKTISNIINLFYR